MTLDNFNSTTGCVKAAAGDFIGELLKDAVHSAVINPYNSAVQLTRSLAKETLHQDLHIHETDALKPTENATGVRAAGKGIGEMTGTVFDYMLTMKALSKMPGLRMAASETTAVEAERLLSARQLTLSGATGFAQGALLTPLQDGDSNWKRVGHGGASALSFMAMEAAPFSPGLNKLEKGFKSDLAKSAFAGAAGGAIQIQSDSILTTGRPADALHTAYATLGGAVGGAAFHGASKISEQAIKKVDLTFLGPNKVATPKSLLDGVLTIAEEPETDSGLVKSMQTGILRHADGSEAKVVIRALDVDDDAWALMRVKRAQTVRHLHELEGFSGKSPDIAVRTENFQGKVQPISVQEYAGKSFGGQLREWTAASKGIDVSSVDSAKLGAAIPSNELADFINKHPLLYEATAEGFARKLADGGLDLNLSNWAIAETINVTTPPDGPIHLYDIDPKRGFGSNTVPFYGPEVKFGDAPHIISLLEGKPLNEISQHLQTTYDELVDWYTRPNGLDSMLKAGLTRAEAEARLERIKYLAEKGFPSFQGTPFPPAPEVAVYFATPEYDKLAEPIDIELLAKAKALTLSDIDSH